MFTRTIDKCTRSVKFEYEPDDQTGERPVWTIERPGSYAPGWEHERYQTTAVKSVGISMISKGNGWTVKGIVIEVEPRDGEPGSIVTTVDPEGAMPHWLANLLTLAVSW